MTMIMVTMAVLVPLTDPNSFVMDTSRAVWWLVESLVIATIIRIAINILKLAAIEAFAYANLVNNFVEIIDAYAKKWYTNFA